MADVAPDHHVAFFAPDGTLVDVKEYASSALSPDWMRFWLNVLHTHGSAFNTALPAPLSHIEVRFSGGGGTALIAFSVHGHPVTSAVALMGLHPDHEAEALRVFVDSVRRISAARGEVNHEPPFATMFDLAQRPLYMAVLWTPTAVEDEQQDLVMHLESHLAAVLLTRL